ERDPMQIRKNKLAACLRMALLSGVAFGVAMPVLAQDASAPVANEPAKKKEDKTLAAVVVTSQSREQKLQEVPIAVQVVNDKMIDELTAYDLGDLDSFVPGLEVSDDSPTQPRFK